MSLPEHATESIVLIDKGRNQTCTGDYVYKRMGGIIAFASASDFHAYKANSDRLLRLTNIDMQFLGAHGIPLFGRDRVSLLSSEMGKIVSGKQEYRYVAHYLIPGIPVRLQQNGDMYIYTTPFVDPPLFWSKWALLAVAAFGTLALHLYCDTRLFFVAV